MSAVDRFVDELGLISQEGGDSRISGRIVGLLLVEGRELSLAEISERLGVSRASVSTNARLLLRRGVIRLTAHADNRRDYYELAAMPFFAMLEDLADRFARHGQSLGRHVSGMRAEDPAAAGRADDLTSFFEKSAIILRDWSKTLRDEEALQEDRQ
ncbi:GbsR/MarR family transcriptional regulator [Devosia elaeis]|uniref:HTH marR-type domain-containing protein n=1 Tax=Devosia elaeis TaxID=1770058 RepID=A0A178HYJ5_9HYPH|nr:MarR family transcriptional regulator [Devosia elaeis]OAM77891.1 hypothetical protein A3840_07965 [Devosia elaeis]